MNLGLRKFWKKRCQANDRVDIRPDVLKVISICDVSNEKAIKDQILGAENSDFPSAYLVRHKSLECKHCLGKMVL